MGILRRPEQQVHGPGPVGSWQRTLGYVEPLNGAALGRSSRDAFLCHGWVFQEGPAGRDLGTLSWHSRTAWKIANRHLALFSWGC